MTANAYQLPDSSLEVYDAGMGDIERGWRVIGRQVVADLERANGNPRMAVYQAVAARTKAGVSTIRQYERFVRKHGALLEELPMVQLTHLRAAAREAKATGESVEQVILRRLGELDGVTLPSHDAWAAQLRKGKRELTFATLVSAARRNLTLAMKKSAGVHRHKIAAVRDALAALESVE